MDLTIEMFGNDIVSHRDRIVTSRLLSRAQHVGKRCPDYEVLYNIRLQVAFGGRSKDFGAPAVAGFDSSRCAVKPIAYYCVPSQPVPADEGRWDERSAEEWGKVAKATPQFEGHYQPRFPHGLGYYDLRVPAVLREQVRLAKLYGLHGFCFHYEWSRTNEQATGLVDSFLADKSLELSFCLFLGKGSRLERWDGGARDISTSQHRATEAGPGHLSDLVRYMADPRYIRVEGRPILVVDQPALPQSLKEMAARWRKEAVSAGYPGLFLVAVNTSALLDHNEIGFDVSPKLHPAIGRVSP